MMECNSCRLGLGPTTVPQFVGPRPNLPEKLRMTFLLVNLCSFLLCACSENHADLRHYLKEVKSKKVKSVKPIPKFPPPSEFTFPEDKNRPNPFKPLSGFKHKVQFGANDP